MFVISMQTLHCKNSVLQSTHKGSIQQGCISLLNAAVLAGHYLTGKASGSLRRVWQRGEVVEQLKEPKNYIHHNVSIKRGELYTLRPLFTRKNEIHSNRTDDNCLLLTVISAFKKSKKVNGK